MPDHDNAELDVHLARMAADIRPALRDVKAFLRVFHAMEDLDMVGTSLMEVQRHAQLVSQALPGLRLEHEEVQHAIREAKSDLAVLRVACVSEAETNRQWQAAQLVRHQDECAAQVTEARQMMAELTRQHERMVAQYADQLQGLVVAIEQKTKELNDIEGRLTALKQAISGTG